MKSNNNSKCVISVIVPMYNSEKYIARCIDSVLQQTFSEFELVLIDDGSTDDTKKICDDYKKNDLRISYHYQKNAGPDYARKKGIEESKGELLLFVDADDYIEKNMLEMMYSNIKDSGADMVCSQFAKQIFSGEPVVTCTMTENLIDSMSVKEHFSYYFEKHYINSSYGTKLFKKELLDGYTYLKDSVIGEDVSIVIFLLQHAKKIRIINNPLYVYCWNQGSISHMGYSSRHYVSLKNYISVKENLLSKNIVKHEEVCGFFAEFEMAVATAMGRSWVFDKKAMNLLRQDMKKDLKYIVKNTYTPVFMKICIFIYTFSPYLFMSIYHVIYWITGR